jgi:hypothetical protein
LSGVLVTRTSVGSMAHSPSSVRVSQSSSTLLQISTGIRHSAAVGRAQAMVQVASPVVPQLVVQGTVEPATQA